MKAEMKYAGILESMGFKKELDERKANLVLFNTCCIRENAENKQKQNTMRNKAAQNSIGNYKKTKNRK